MAERIIRIGGVPEHFNYPWKLILDEQMSGHQSSVFEWTDFPGGSGAMLQALGQGEIDAALVLTESVVHALNQGLPIVPLSVFVESPLIWGIFSGAQNSINQVIPAKSLKYAISRFGSGSHLMAILDAYIRGGEIKPDQFIPVGNLDGACSSLVSGETDLFFWEKWMTKPLVDKGLLKLLDERPTPWSCFLLVVSAQFATDEVRMDSLKSTYLEVLKAASVFCEEGTAPQQLASLFGLEIQDATTWMRQVKWATKWIKPNEQMQLARDWLAKLNT